MPNQIRELNLFLLFFALLSCATQLASAADSSKPEPLEPDVAPASDEASAAMAGIRIPSHWEIGLFAAEPDVANVVSFDIDHRGRVFVCESYRQNRGVTDNREHDATWVLADLSSKTVQDRIDYHKRLLGEEAATYSQHDDRIRRLDDSDRDGKADRSYVLAKGFNQLEEGTGAGILVRGDEIFYSCIPKLWKLVDKDDNGDAEQRLPMSDGYGVRVALRGHDLHGLIIGPDGRLYFSIGDRGYHVTTDDGRLLSDPKSGAVFRCELDGSGLEVFARGMRNPQELAFNDLGDLFSVDNNSDSGDRARIINILEGGDSGWRMQFQYIPDRGPFNRERIWEPFHREQPAYLVPPITNFADGPSGLALYPGTGFGNQLKDTFFVCDFRGSASASGIRSFKLEPDGAFYKLGEQSDPIWRLLATDVAFGPDGAMYVSDWVASWDGVGKGRIYRLTDPEHRDSEIVRQVQDLLQSDWSTRDGELLADDLGHVDRRVRLEAQWELARRSEDQRLLEIALNQDQKGLARLHAVWGADQIARLDSDKRATITAALRALLDSSNAMLRAAAAKVMGERGDVEATERLRQLLADESPRVQYFAALSLGKLKDPSSFDAAVAMLERNDNQDPALRHAGVMYLTGMGQPDSIVALAQHPSESVRRAAVVALRRLKSDLVSQFLDDESSLVVAEAARAIHDEPIPVALSELAGLTAKGGIEPELIRRSLNANFRLGTPEAADRVAQYAGRPEAPAAVRVEALDMLATWAAPDPRDRVLNDVRPLENRDPAIATAALAKQIEGLISSEADVRNKAIDVAAGLGIQEIVPELAKRVADSNLDAATRGTALRALALLNGARAIELAREVKLLPVNDLVFESLLVLAAGDANQSFPRFIEATESRNLELRQLAWDILGNLPANAATDAIVAGVESYLDGSMSPEVSLNVLEAAENRLPDGINQRLAEHTASLAEQDPLGPWLAALEGGNVERGRKIFVEKTQLSCVRCHKIRLKGGEVGPDLTSVAKDRDRRYLLESICRPNAQIAKGFETSVIVDDSGQLHSGIVKADNDDYVELIQSDGSLKRIPAEEIVGRRNGESAMPGDLIKQMNLRELRDLVAYLASLTG